MLSQRDTSVVDVLLRLCRDDRGQDVVEYALLTGAIGLAGIAVFDQLSDVMKNHADTVEIIFNDIWIPEAPGGS